MIMRRWFGYFKVTIALACLAASTGCRSFSFSDPVIGASYKPKNIFSKAGPWPREIRRVAILPMAYNENQPNTVSGRDLLEPILHTELAKAQRFECISVSAEFVKKWTHKEKWSSTEMLPGDMIQILKTEIGCDAVLFAELTQYRPYPPLVIGWNMKLVSVSTQEILWAVDETFDAGELPVANAARRFEMQREQPNPVLAESRQVLISPRRFGQFTTETLVATVPEYKEPPNSTRAAHRAAPSKAAASKAVASEVAVPDAATPDVAASKAAAPEVAESKAATPDVAASEVAASKATAPDVAASDVAASEAAVSKAAAKAATKAEASKAAASKAEASKAEASKAAASKAAASKAAASKAAAAKAEASKAAAAKAAASKAAAKAAASKAAAKAAASKAAASDSTVNDSTNSNSTTYEVGVSPVGATRFGDSGVGGSGNRQSGPLPKKGASEQSSAENDKR